jgi:hypothetical protein
VLTTSENPLGAKFAGLPFHALGWIGFWRSPEGYTKIPRTPIECKEKL